VVQDWTVVTIGNLSRNRYWGDGEDQPVRPTRCTCTLLRCDDGTVLVDPSCQDPQEMAAELDRTTGLRLADVSVVFLTHEHGDHHYGLQHFPHAGWVAAPEVAAAVNAAEAYEKLVQPVTGRLPECLELVPTPGHTPGHHSLRFTHEGLSFVVAGDAVMTRDFWREQRPFLNAVDQELAKQSMAELAPLAQAIVPGHGNWFLAKGSETAR
jgi:glyoxylase-like metal-dependent hydrolase (beta-lactamase superfamily II)